MKEEKQLGRTAALSAADSRSGGGDDPPNAPNAPNQQQDQQQDDAFILEEKYYRHRHDGGSGQTQARCLDHFNILAEKKLISEGRAADADADADAAEQLQCCTRSETEETKQEEVALGTHYTEENYIQEWENNYQSVISNDDENTLQQQKLQEKEQSVARRDHTICEDSGEDDSILPEKRRLRSWGQPRHGNSETPEQGVDNGMLLSEKQRIGELRGGESTASNENDRSTLSHTECIPSTSSRTNSSRMNDGYVSIPPSNPVLDTHFVPSNNYVEENLPEPGVVHIRGMQPERQGSIRIGFDPSLDDHLASTNNTSNTTRDHEDVLVHAQIVQEVEMKVLATATPDSWWRRHQWWLVGATLFVIGGITLTAVLTIVDFDPGSAPTTMAPTSIVDGVESQVSDLIVSILPSAEKLLADKSTPQYQALQWVVEQRLDNRDLYTDTLVLHQYSLAALFFSTNADGSSWFRFDGWLKSPSSCDWYGIECAADDSSGEEVVVAVNLTDNGLRGNLVSDVLILADTLLFLDLSHNDLIGSLPEEFGKMTSLLYLSLANNTFEHSIPSSFGSMTELLSLDLSSNSLKSTIPRDLGGLVELEQLLLEENELIGEVPSEIGLLSNLERLEVSANRLSFALPTELGKLIRLKTLAAHDNFLLGPLPSEVGLLSGLERFLLSGNYIFQTLPSEIGELTNLKSLDISNNLLTGTLPASLGLLNQLSLLRVNSNFLEGDIPIGLASVDALVILDVSSNFLKGSPFSPTLRLPRNLQELDLSSNDISDVISPAISLLGNLTRIDFSDSSVVGTIPSEIGLLKKMVSMDFSVNELTGPIPSELWSLTHLEILHLDMNSLTGTGISTDVASLTDLHVLDLHGNPLLEGSIPSELGVLTNLETLWLSYMALSGSLPTEIGLLAVLSALRVQSNTISGTIPSEVGLLSSLQAFSIHGNGISGPIPSEIAAMASLESCQFGNNFLSGTLPSEIFLLSQLAIFFVVGNKLSGTIPTQVEKTSRVKILGLAINQFSGTIPSEIGLMTKLGSIVASFNSFSGSIPSELGLLQRMQYLSLLQNTLSGKIPSEIGLLRDLGYFYADENAFSGTIPLEISLLSNLEGMYLSQNNLVGTLPSEIGNLSKLQELWLAYNSLTGRLPSELGRLHRLRSLDLNANALTGSIPPELEMISLLNLFNILNSELTGSIPKSLCDAASFFQVQCEEVTCACCNCPTLSPSTPPTLSISPTITPAPSPSPSMSLEPSVSISPSIDISCSPFTSIASFGSRLSILDQHDVSSEVVDLPRGFNWRGEVEYRDVTVSKNGVIFPGRSDDDGCYDGSAWFPIQVGGIYEIPRIAVAQHAFMGGSIYTAQLDSAIVISWEGVHVPLESPSLNSLDFQVLLFPTGKVEMRWGEGNPSAAYFFTGLEDDSVGVAVPVTGESFSDTLLGFSVEWPTDQCRIFAPIKGGYDEITPTSLPTT